MSTIIKTLRITAQLLILVTAITLLSGLLSVKSFLLPWFGGFDAYYWHVVILPLIFVPLVYVHSLMGILLFFERNQKFNKLHLKIIAAGLWSALFVLFVFLYAVQPETPKNTIKSNVTTQDAKAEIFLNASELARHNSGSDCWMTIGGKVYNLSNYAGSHPGGTQNIISFCGKDGTNAFATKGGKGDPHSQRAQEMLSSFYVGDFGTRALIGSTSNILPITQPGQETEEGEDD